MFIQHIGYIRYYYKDALQIVQITAVKIHNKIKQNLYYKESQDRLADLEMSKVVLEGFLIR